MKQAPPILNVYQCVPPHDVLVNGRPLDPAPSLRLRNHSPTGFSWGYGGSGPAQLALAILLNEYGADFATRHYQEFKSLFVAGPSMDSAWSVDSNAIRAWVSQRGYKTEPQYGESVECRCYLDCGDDSHSGRWHQHEGEECKLHPGLEVVG